MCEPKASVPVRVPVAAVAALAGVALAVSWLTQAWPLVLAGAAALAVLAAAGAKVLSVVSRWSSRLSVRSGSLASSLVPVKRARALALPAPARRAIEAPRAAIGGKPVLTGTVLARDREAVR